MKIKPEIWEHLKRLNKDSIIRVFYLDKDDNLRHFSHYEDGMAYYFDGGRSSETQKGVMSCNPAEFAIVAVRRECEC